MNAMTAPVRKRKSTWPSVDASRNARTSRTGRPTSWTQRGILIVGPGPAIARIVARPCRAWQSARLGQRRPCYGQRDGDAPLTACGAASRRTAAGRRLGRGGSRSPVASRCLLVVTLALTAFDGHGATRAPTVSRPDSRARHHQRRPSRSCSRPSATSASSHPSRRTASPRSASTARATDALVLQPVGPQANEGMLARLWRPDHGLERTAASPGTSSRERRAAHARRRRRSPGPTSTRRSTGPSSRFATTSSRGADVGAEIELRPSSAPSLVVGSRTCEPDPALTSARTSPQDPPSSAPWST